MNKVKTDKKTWQFMPSGDRNRNFKTRDPNYNWFPRVTKLPCIKSQLFTSKLFYKVHFLASHSPKPVCIKWSKVSRKLELRKYGNSTRQSMRYANTYTAHAWL